MGEEDIVLTVRATTGSGSDEEDIVKARPRLFPEVVGFLCAEDTGHSIVIGTRDSGDE